VAACRLIPKTDAGPFPYDEAKRLLLFEQPAMTFEPKDFAPVIAAGREHCHWSAEVIRQHEEMAQRGRCFDFRLERPPHLQGTLFEDNIWFSFYSPQHQKSCLRFIEALREKLDVQILHH